jgi:ribonuclease R
MVADMTISANGSVSGYTFYQAVMHSHARLTYNKVSDMLERPDSEPGYRLSEQYAHVLPHLHNLYNLYKLLRKARTERGAIDFETTETRVIFDASRKIEEIAQRRPQDRRGMYARRQRGDGAIPQEAQGAITVPGARWPIRGASQCGAAFPG